LPKPKPHAHYHGRPALRLRPRLCLLAPLPPRVPQRCLGTLPLVNLTRRSSAQLTVTAVSQAVPQPASPVRDLDIKSARCTPEAEAQDDDEVEADVEGAGASPQKEGEKKAKGKPKAKKAKGEPARPKAKKATAEDTGKAKRKPSPYFNFMKTIAAEWNGMTQEQKDAYKSVDAE
jgi:hypothetical protein